jgi:hypothetical protein
VLAGYRDCPQVLGMDQPKQQSGGVVHLDDQDPRTLKMGTMESWNV